MAQPKTEVSNPAAKPQDPITKTLAHLCLLGRRIATDCFLANPIPKGHSAVCVALAFLLVWLLTHKLTDHDTSLAHLPSQRLTTSNSYFTYFNGFAECKIRATDLYAPPRKDHLRFHGFDTFCHDRQRLLQALSEGGRIGFDSPYLARDCHYRWYEIDEICFVLERFDGLVFVGNDILQTIDNEFNIHLRKDLAPGALDLIATDDKTQRECRCNNQFTRQECQKHYATDSEGAQHDAFGSVYSCNRIRHAFLKVEGAEPSEAVLEKFKQIIPGAPESQYSLIPIIHSLGRAMAPASDAAASLLKVVQAADASDRNTPILWVGPTAAGHIELKGQKGNQEIWDFDRHMADVARQNDMDVLGMWNMTSKLQAGMVSDLAKGSSSAGNDRCQLNQQTRIKLGQHSPCSQA